MSAQNQSQFTININVTQDEIKRLNTTMMGCFYFDKNQPEGRFVPINKNEKVDPSIYKDWESTMEWCDNILSAIILKNYRQQIDKVDAIILWDHCGQDSNYVVLHSLDMGLR